jgi:hypothetical protein
MKLKPGAQINFNRQKYEGEIPDDAVAEIEKNVGDEKAFKAWKAKYAYNAKRDDPKEPEPVKDESKNKSD